MTAPAVTDYPEVRRSSAAHAAIRYDIPTPYGSYRDYVDVAAAQLLDLSLFRHAPHALKPGIYRDQQWLIQQRIASQRGPEARPRNDPLETSRFLREFATRVIRGRRRTRLHAGACSHAARAGRDGRGLQLRAQQDAHPGRLHEPGTVRPVSRSGHCSIDFKPSTSTTEARSLLPLTTERTCSCPRDQHPMGGVRSPAGVTLAKIEPCRHASAPR